jgi:hypothetical protein
MGGYRWPFARRGETREVRTARNAKLSVLIAALDIGSFTFTHRP